MNGFKKLLLTTAILAASSSAMAMQAMDDESLSGTTGQDGITINVANSTLANLDITWVDRDGFTGYVDDGALKINNLGVTITNLDIVVDAGSDAINGAQLNVDISTTDDIIVDLSTSSLQVATGGVGSATSGATDIVTFSAGSSLTITGGISANLKLGNRGAGEDFMTLSTDALSPFDVVLTGVTVLDAVSTAANGAGNDVGIGIGRLAITGIVLNNAINVADNGLTINTAGTVIGEVAMETIKLGDQVTALSLGDVYLNGLTTNTTLTISGH